MTNLTDYLNLSVEHLVHNALRKTISNPKESAFLLQMMHAQKAAALQRCKFEKTGQHIPPFLIASIASECNLHCIGCYARANHACCDEASAEELKTKDWERIFDEAARDGIFFILLAGGEPLLRRDVIGCAAKVKNIIFPIFTNGTMINQDYIELFDTSRNLIPILSIEGDEAVTDKRRGSGTFQSLRDSIQEMDKHGILWGASVTVTHETIGQVTSEKFIGWLEQEGCKIVFYVEYVPAVEGTESSVLSDKERSFLSMRQEDLKCKYEKLIFISFPGDEKKLGGCLAAGRGFFHINAIGHAEPCPFSPYSDTSLVSHSLLEALQSPLFKKLQEQNLTKADHIGGCALFNQQKEIRKLLKEEC